MSALTVAAPLCSHTASGRKRFASVCLEQVLTVLTAVRRTALRLLRVHPIRTADALQLAAALAAAHGDPSTLAFLSGDARLSAAADIEGFPVT